MKKKALAVDSLFPQLPRSLLPSKALFGLPEDTLSVAVPDAVLVVESNRLRIDL